MANLAYLTDAAAHALVLEHPEVAATSGAFHGGWTEAGHATVEGTTGEAWVTAEFGSVALTAGIPCLISGTVRLTAEQARALAAALTVFADLAD